MLDHDIDMQIVLKTILKVCSFFCCINLVLNITLLTMSTTVQKKDNIFFLISQKKDNMF